MADLAKPRSRKPKRVVPLCGEPLAGALTDTSASHLAARLAEETRGSRRYASSLHNVPALIPVDMPPGVVDGVYKLLARIPGYVEIFGAPDPRALEGPRARLAIDTVLTSISTDDQPWGSRNGALLASAGIDAKELRQLAVGDIGGVLLPAPGKSAAVTRLMRNWTGVGLADLQRTASAGRLLVVAMGANKARVLREVLRRGLCTHVIIDEQLLFALERLIVQELSPKP
jgi:DNA-binding transcriptional regulator LsrR (DeoR family)